MPAVRERLADPVRAPAGELAFVLGEAPREVGVVERAAGDQPLDRVGDLGVGVAALAEPGDHLALGSLPVRERAQRALEGLGPHAAAARP